MISEFPKFKKLKIEDKEQYNKLLKNLPPYSDHHFTGLWTYNTEGNVEVCTINHNIALKTFDYLTQEPFITFIGTHKINETITDLLEFCKTINIRPLLKHVPEISILPHIETLSKTFSIKEDRDNFDYILSVASMTTLTNKELHSIRKHVRTFAENHPSPEIKKLDISEKLVQEDILEVFSHWQKHRNKTDAEVETEHIALKRAFEYAKYFNFVTIGMFMGTKMIAYTINEPIENHFYVGHFGKALPSYLGLSQVLEVETAKVMKTLGCEFMNFEQDLGFPGLRTNKMSWHPVAFLKKYIVEPLHI
jgi:uncharacterized protein